MPATAISLNVPSMDGFRSYLEQSLRNPFVIDLKGCTLNEVISACEKTKSKLHPNYTKSISCLKYNLNLLEEKYHIVLEPVQITDIFWGYFISFCQSNGLMNSTIETMANQLRSILNWASKYNATVSPTYRDFQIKKETNQEIALTADDVSRIAYFDIDRFYKDRRSDYRHTMKCVRDMFVLSCNLMQRHSDMVRISKSCFERNIFRITQQKTGNLAVVDIDKYAITPKTVYKILKQYNHEAPFKGCLRNYNKHLRDLMKDIGFTEEVRIEHRANGELVAENIPKYKLIASHTARRTGITINVLRGRNLHDVKKCSGHTDLRVFDEYIRD